MGERPTQKTSKKDKQWYKDNADYHIKQCNWMSLSKTEMDMLFMARDGILTKEMYKHVLNPYDVTDPSLLAFPADLRNYDILNPPLDTAMGEKGSMFPAPIVICTNDDAPNKLKIHLKEQEQAFLAQMFVNELNGMGVDTGVDTKPVPDNIPAELKRIKENWDDTRAIVGQEAMNYLVHYLEFDEVHQRLFNDWLTIGRICTYKEVSRDDVGYERVDPREIWAGGSITPFLEDGDWVVRQMRLPLSNVIDKFRSEPELTSTVISDLETRYRNLSPENGRMLGTRVPEGADSVSFVTGLMEVYHIVWKSFKKIGILEYIDDLTGEIEEMEVDADYEVDILAGDIKLKHEWINEVHEVYRIGEEALDLYVRGQAIPVQRNEINNTSKCKLPYNGRYDDNDMGGLKSLANKGLPYQVLFNTYHYRLELLVAKNKDKLMSIPIGLKPKNWSWDKWMHELDTTNLLFFNELAEGAAQALSALKSIDMALGDYIEKLYNIMMNIKYEWWEAAGMNRQRMSDIKERDGKGNTEQAIYRSALSTSELYRRFDKTIERDYNGLLDYSKVAFANGKKGSYITSDNKKVYFEINGEDYCEYDFGVFVKDTSKEADKIKAMKGYGLELLQNGVNSGAVADMMDAENMSSIKKILREADEAKQQYEMILQENQAKLDQQTLAMQDQINAAQHEREKEISNMESATKIEVAQITTEGSITAASMRSDKGELQPTVTEEDGEGSKNILAERKQAADEIKANNELISKERDRKSKEKIATTNKNRYDKKK